MIYGRTGGMQMQKSLKITSVLKKHNCFYLYAFLRDLCGIDRFLTSYMRHYVLGTQFKRF